MQCGEGWQSSRVGHRQEVVHGKSSTPFWAREGRHQLGSESILKMTYLYSFLTYLSLGMRVLAYAYFTTHLLNAPNETIIKLEKKSCHHKPSGGAASV